MSEDEQPEDDHQVNKKRKGAQHTRVKTQSKESPKLVDIP